MLEEKIEKSVTKVLRRANIPLSFLGFYYLKEILIKKYNEEFKYTIYKEFAPILHTTPSRMERSIRYICDSYQKQLQSYFHTNYKITTKKLFYLLSTEVQEEIECYS